MFAINFSFKKLIPYLIVGFFICWYGSITTYHNYQNDEENIRFYLLSGLFLDDSFYYYKTALNLTKLGLISFDGINITNGFHPLWLLICAPLVSILSPAVFLNSIIWLQLLLYFSSAIFLVKSIDSKKYETLLIILCLSLLSTDYLLRISLNGLETCLYLFSISGALYAFNRYLKDGSKIWNLLFWLILVFLARIDGVLLSAVILLVILLKNRNFAAFKIGAGLGLVVGLYLIFNYVTVGEFLPVSGITKEINANHMHQIALKSGVSSVSLWSGYLFWPKGNAYLMAIFLINCLSIVLFGFKKKYVGLSIALFCCLKYLVYILSYKNAAGSYLWYYVPDFLCSIYVLIYFVNFLLNKFKNNFFHISILIMCVYYTSVENTILSSNMRHHFNRIHSIKNPIVGGDLDIYYLSAQLLNKYDFPLDTVFGMHNSGVFGFFSKYKIVNMDGLINGKKRLDYGRKYPYEWIQYVDESQPISAYFDLISPNNVPAYNKLLGPRGFSISQINEDLYSGWGKFTLPADQLIPMLYLGPGLRNVKESQ